MLKKTASSIAPHLTQLFNLSLREGKVPTDWKTSNVTPIHKSGDKSAVTNYRPISLLSLVSKVLEKIIHNRITEYLCSNDLLSSNQFGFRPGFSTQDALLTVTNDWHQLLSTNRQIAAVFFDLRKAFDSVPHPQLIEAITSFGISGFLLSWISDYLSNRLQRVVLEGASSTPSKVTSGVPQGSILGPLLFILFMDSLNSVTLSPGTKLILYADDILLYRPVDTPLQLALLEEDISRVHKWTLNHGLTLNPLKTNVLPITRSRKPLPLNITINGQPIPSVNSAKYLGVTISSNLTWSKHIDNTVKSVKRQLGMLHRKLHKATPQARNNILRSTILPKLDYCAAVWDPHHSTLTHKLERTQAFACKVITHQWKTDYNSLRSKLNYTTLKDRRTYIKLKICYKIMNNHSCFPSSVFTPHPSPSPRHPHNQMLFIPHVATSSHKHSFFIDVVRSWNSLPQLLISATNVQSFKSNFNQTFPNGFSAPVHH